MVDVEIVRIGPEHIVGFHRVLDQVARERRYLSFLEGPSIETSRAFVLEHIERRWPHYVAISWEGEVVGWCDVTPKTRPIYSHGGVLGMGILPEFRGQGVGAKLIRAALNASHAIGLHRVELTVREGNAAAIALYNKVGFVTEGVHRDAVRVDGDYENVVFMAIVFEKR
jgi:RimJ/RimL family protein N-acetyltransferase